MISVTLPVSPVFFESECNNTDYTAMGKHFLFPILWFFTTSCAAQPSDVQEIHTGADQIEKYLPIVKDKKVGLFVNHTSLVSQVHLTDTLLALGVDIVTVFSPEHGFKGNLADGELIENQENKRDFELISLYGSAKRPTDEAIQKLDMLVIDIQDVGVRFYTYASTMTYLMEACAKNNVPVLVLDRPNPNGSYIDGPVLNEKFESFIGLHPIPLVHGLTLGELALMINGEGWLEATGQCDLKVIPAANWEHSTRYNLPVNPSPNLPNALAVSLYPSLGLFEGTIVSVGRGTDIPFQVIGHPLYEQGTYTFVPQPNEGSKYPPLEAQTCKGISFRGDSIQYEFTLSYLIEFYNALKDKGEKPFFNDYFVRLAGTDQLQAQIVSGMTEQQIRETWQEELASYQQIRKKYLLYPD